MGVSEFRKARIMSEPEKKGDQTESPPPASTELWFLEPSTLHFARKGAALTLAVDGDVTAYEKVRVYRIFPLSHPGPVHFGRRRRQPLRHP